MGCAEPDPELLRFRTALDAWRRGQAAATPAEAAAAYADARTSDPDSVALGLWRAKAQADAGDLAGADATLTELLRAHPDAGGAWYNRAAYRARRAQLDDAKADLAQALALGVVSPLEASADPDFVVLRTQPGAEALLPPQPVVLRVEGPDGSVFLGSRFAVEAYVGAIGDTPITLRRAGADPGCVRLARVVEDQREDRRMRVRRITLDLVAESACNTQLGPWVATAGEAQVEVAAIPLVVEVPPGANSTVVTLPEVVPVPSMVAGADAAPRAMRVAGGVAAMGRADQSMTGNGAEPDIGLEWRVDGQTRSVGGWWRADGPVEVKSRAWAVTVP